MNEFTLHSLEYDKIKQYVSERAVSYLGKQHVADMQPITSYAAIRAALNETEEALAILQSGGNVPLPSLTGMEAVLGLLGKGYLFSETDFAHLYTFLHSCAQLKKYMAAKTATAPTTSRFATSLYDLDELKNEIERCIRNGSITDAASKDLNKVRKQIAVTEERIKTRISALMSKHRAILQEAVVSMRGERYVLPIRREYRKQLPGSVLDESSSGQTVYIEPAEIAHLQSELLGRRAEEAREESKILGLLTQLTEQSANELQRNVETIGVYDFLFAKAKYALVSGGRNVALNKEGVIRLQNATHPLLGADMVPLDFAIGERYQTLIITGPNTGGKTIALKTVGLLTLMAQSGMLVPAGDGSTIGVFTSVAADIGDGQSIEQSLSTFSAHMKRVIDILQTADATSLVLIDEMASGTDPGEGIGLSIAVLEELQRRGTRVVATTHYNEIKHFAAVTPGFENARMAFDPDTLQPRYELRIGEAGQSYAFLIAQKLGIPPRIIERSREISASGFQRQTDETSQFDVSAGPTDQQASATIMPIDRSTATTDAASEQLEKPIDTTAAPTDQQASTVATPARPAPALGAAGNLLVEDAAAPAEPLADKTPVKRFELGDSVSIAYLGKTGIVCKLADAHGMVGVTIEKQRHMINHKRLALHIPKAELYPDDYDFDIIFETKEDRKKRKLMRRKHVEGVVIIKKPEDQ